MTELAMIAAIDLFCGAGGLTAGLRAAGIDVRLGIDLDPCARLPYEENNEVPFLEADVFEVKVGDLRPHLASGDVSLLAGCAPCQPFSSYTSARASAGRKKYERVGRFLSIVEDLRPDLVTMENVPYLASTVRFQRIVRSLREAGYDVWHGVVKAEDYGIPQMRRRLVVLASRLGSIEMPACVASVSQATSTVREAIGDLPSLAAGEVDAGDPLHRAARLTPVNLRRIRASSPGGTWRDWPKHLRTECHKRESGAKSVSIYGRMEWDQPAPTITTQAYNYGSGRFGHPEQDRAISLREAALLQSFPRAYRFEDAARGSTSGVARLIGNAVPPRLGATIGLAMTRAIS